MLMRIKSRLSDPRGRKKGEGEVGWGEVRADRVRILFLDGREGGRRGVECLGDKWQKGCKIVAKLWGQ